ncbi:hypothetical protein AB0424_07425 [Streptomyces sp. NPDC051180]|uniref:hypothetical protein n=1 Tax=Streptomyces sp. NPDC051180 TaxID=3155797 RepID=UPI00344CC649
MKENGDESTQATESTREVWLNRMSVTGLTVSEEPTPENVPSPNEAMRSVSNWEVQPVSKVPLSHPDAHQEVDRQWYAQATQAGLFSEDGSFLLSISGSGSSGFGWAAVKWNPTVELTSRLARESEGLDFVAMSEDGRTVCAVTEEEYDYWIVVQHLR